MALTLVHEVAHAFSAEHHGFLSEAYFADNRYIEMGVALEGWLTGGYIYLPDDAAVHHLRVKDVGTNELAKGFSICGTSTSNLNRLPPSIHCWLVGIGYIWRLFL